MNPSIKLTKKRRIYKCTPVQIRDIKEKKQSLDIFTKKNYLKQLISQTLILKLNTNLVNLCHDACHWVVNYILENHVKMASFTFPIRKQISGSVSTFINMMIQPFSYQVNFGLMSNNVSLSAPRCQNRFWYFSIFTKGFILFFIGGSNQGFLNQTVFHP